MTSNVHDNARARREDKRKSAQVGTRREQNHDGTFIEITPAGISVEARWFSCCVGGWIKRKQRFPAECRIHRCRNEDASREWESTTVAAVKERADQILDGKMPGLSQKLKVNQNNGRSRLPPPEANPPFNHGIYAQTGNPLVTPPVPTNSFTQPQSMMKLSRWCVRSDLT